MDTIETEGFFPERAALRSRRLRVMVDAAPDPFEATIRRVATWMTVSAEVFSAMFGSAVIFGWITLRASLEVAVCAIACVLVVASVLAAVKLRRGFLRANTPAS